MKYTMTDFFESRDALDAFLLGLKYNQVARIRDGVLRVFQCNHVDAAGNASGARLIQNILPVAYAHKETPAVSTGLVAGTDTKKKRHRH